MRSRLRTLRKHIEKMFLSSHAPLVPLTEERRGLGFIYMPYYIHVPLSLLQDPEPEISYLYVTWHEQMHYYQRLATSLGQLQTNFMQLARLYAVKGLREKKEESVSKAVEMARKVSTLHDISKAAYEAIPTFFQVNRLGKRYVPTQILKDLTQEKVELFGNFFGISVVDKEEVQNSISDLIGPFYELSDEHKQGYSLSKSIVKKFQDAKDIFDITLKVANYALNIDLFDVDMLNWESDRLENELERRKAKLHPHQRLKALLRKDTNEITEEVTQEEKLIDDKIVRFRKDVVWPQITEGLSEEEKREAQKSGEDAKRKLLGPSKYRVVHFANRFGFFLIPMLFQETTEELQVTLSSELALEYLLREKGMRRFSEQAFHCAQTALALLESREEISRPATYHKLAKKRVQYGTDSTPVE